MVVRLFMSKQHLVSTCCSACTSEMTSLILVLVLVLMLASKPFNIEMKIIVFTLVLALLVKTRRYSQSCLRVSAEFLEI